MNVDKENNRGQPLDKRHCLITLICVEKIIDLTIKSNIKKLGLYKYNVYDPETNEKYDVEDLEDLINQSTECEPETQKKVFISEITDPKSKHKDPHKIVETYMYVIPPLNMMRITN